MKKRFINIVIFICYSILTFFLCYKHEILRDEAQAWLIARDLDPIGIIKQMWYEGHPSLWHSILFPFAKLGFKVGFIKYISWSIMEINAFLILRYSKFPTIVKFAILFSSPYLYFYPAIARSYCLIPLFLTLISIYYNKRHNNVIMYTFLICLLQHTHVLMFASSIILYLIFLYEMFIENNRRDKFILMSFLLFLFSTILFLFQLVPAYFLCSVIFSNVENGRLLSLLDIYYSKLFYFISGYINRFLCVFFIFFVCFFCDKIKIKIIFLISIFFQFFIHLKYSVSDQRAYLIFLIVIFVFEISLNEFKRRNILCYVTIIILSFFSIFNKNRYVQIIAMDVLYKVSAANVVSFIEENIPNNSVFIDLCQYNTAIISNLDSSKNITFFSPFLNESYTYFTWRDWLSYTDDSLKELILFLKTKNKNVYIIGSFINNFDYSSIAKETRKIYYEHERFENLDFIIYEISGDMFNDNLALKYKLRLNDRRKFLDNKIVYAGIEYYEKLNF